MIKHPKSLRQLTVSHNNPSSKEARAELKRGRKLQAEVDAEAMRTAAYWLAQFSYSTQDHLTRSSNTQ